MLDADWPAPPGVHALTTLRHGAGVSPAPFDHFNFGNTGPGGDAPGNVAANRAELARVAALPAPPRWLRQVHGTEVRRFDRPHPGPLPQAGEGAEAAPHVLDHRGRQPVIAAPAFPPLPLAGEGRGEGASAHADLPEADASATEIPGTVLAILTADCLPVVFAAMDGSEVAAAHAGWRGLAAGVLERTLDAMTTPAAEIVAWLGPAAGPDAYEIGAEVFDAFTGPDPDASAAFVATRPGHWRVDLYALARRRLAAAGMRRDAIHGGTHCTIGEPQRFFSHRRDARTGRMATLVWIAQP
nr:peptidoglycan editing factor PgeF [Luteimonas sp. BDR2-5]